MPLSNPTLRVPSYRGHKPSGQAVVTRNGRDFYLGKWNTRASRDEYDRLIGEWLAGGRCLPSDTEAELSVAEVALRFRRHAKSYYVKEGLPTGELAEYKLVIRLLRQHYGTTPARQFGPLALNTLRQAMVSAGLARGVVNQRTSRIKRILKWAVAEELVPPAVHQALAAVEGLRRGRAEAGESKPVRPVAGAVVDAALPHLPIVVAGMVRLQRFTGWRRVR